MTIDELHQKIMNDILTRVREEGYEPGIDLSVAFDRACFALAVKTAVKSMQEEKKEGMKQWQTLKES